MKRSLPILAALALAAAVFVFAPVAEQATPMLDWNPVPAVFALGTPHPPCPGDAGLQCYLDCFNTRANRQLTCWQ